MGATLSRTMMGYIGLGNYKLISLARVDSTQNYARDMILSHRATDGVAVMADVQTAGRGRHSRKWVSASGNLYISFIFDAPIPDGRLAYRVAVAVADAIESFGITCEIKWPNDILINGAKVCGILIEYVGAYVIVGIGVNIASAPDVGTYATACLAQYTDVTRAAFMGRLTRALDVWRVAEFARVRDAWMAHAVGLGQVVQYRGRDVQMCGIDDDGGLVLSQDGVRCVVYGDEIIMENSRKSGK